MNPGSLAAIAAAFCLYQTALAAAPKKPASAATAPAEVTAENMLIVRDTARELARTHGSARVLVVYDIDNTLLTSTTALGSDQWFVWQEEKIKTENPERITKGDFKCLLDAQEMLYFTRPMRLTHESVMWSVESLRSEGFTQWVITSRGPELAGVTFRELGRSRLAFSDFHGARTTGTQDFQIGSASVRMQDGVLFTSGSNKGDALREVLRRTGRSGDFSAIVFADDTPKHLPRMRTAFEKSGIDVRTFLYQAVKADVDDFNADGSASKALARKQWCELVKDIPAYERIAPDVLNLTHDDDDGTRHALSACIVNACP